MRSVFKWMLISGAATAGAYVVFPAIKKGRGRLERGLRNVERAASRTRLALMTAERALADAEQVVNRIHRRVW